MLNRTKNIIQASLSFLVIVLFVYTGVSKLIGHELFISQLSQICFLRSAAPFLSFLIPVLEIVTALLILINYTRLYGWWMAFTLMTLFTAYVFIMLQSNTALPCTCGGVLPVMSWKQHLYFNMFFFCVSWYMVLNITSQTLLANKKEVS